MFNHLLICFNIFNLPYNYDEKEKVTKKFNELHGRYYTFNNTTIEWTNPIVTDIIKLSRNCVPISRSNGFVSINTYDEERLVPKHNDE